MSLLRLENISKKFPGVQALKDVSFNLNKGEVHALVGENGAGKSTLMNVISGIINPSSGSIFIEDEKVNPDEYNPLVSKKLGIAHVHQELSLCPTLSIAENIFYNSAPINSTGVIKQKQLYKKSKELLDLLEINESPDTIVEYLSFGVSQQIEILKAVAQNAKVIIFDEPTTGISDKEIEMLFKVINKLKKDGLGIIYISHKLDEVLEISDKITVLRDGQKIETLDNDNVGKNTIISLMVGRKINDIYPDRDKNIHEETVLEIKDVYKEGLIEDINFQLKKGEILGISGLVGAGRSEMCDVIFGLVKKDKGTIKIDGKEVKINNATDAINNGMSYLPEDRKKQGLFLDMSIMENIIVSKLSNYTKGKTGIMNVPKQKEISREYVGRLNVSTNDINKIVKQLSGGNQQKVLLSKWISILPKILIIDEPTKGVDVGAKSDIYNILRNLAKEGMAIIMVSSELPEILGVADRTLIMHDGKIIGDLNIEEASQEKIMQTILLEK